VDPPGSRPGAVYDELIEIDLAALEPLAACPHSPDAVKPVRMLKGLKVDQVLIGSCTNSSLKDLLAVAAVLKGRKVHLDVSLAIAPGSRQVLEMLSASGALKDIIASGARILEAACGPGIGMGQAPPSGGVSVRTFNRNFKGRSGTADAQVYLASPETAVACALTGAMTDPRDLGVYPDISLPASFRTDDSMIVRPEGNVRPRKIRRGPNIKALPKRGAMEDALTLRVLLKLKDNVTTDDIMPAGSKILPLRSNIEAMSRYVFSGIDEAFSEHARDAGPGCVLSGDNYGQGSSREHAALRPCTWGSRPCSPDHLPASTGQTSSTSGSCPLSLTRMGMPSSSRGNGHREEHPRRLAGVSLGCIHLRGEHPPELYAHPLEREADLLMEGGLLNYISKKVRG
jgi:aconitate hydratase